MVEKKIVGHEADITEIERTEEERAVAGFIEAMPIGVVVMDLEGRILRDNKAANRMFGYGKTLGKPVTDFINKEDVPRALEAIQECIRKGYYRNFECTGAAKDGRKFPLLVDGTLMRNSEGNPSSIVITFRDITELKRAEEERMIAVQTEERMNALQSLLREKRVATELITEMSLKKDAMIKKLADRIKELENSMREKKGRRVLQKRKAAAKKEEK